MRGILALAVLIVISLGVAGCGGSTADRAVVVNGHDVPMHSYQVAFANKRQQEVDSIGYDPCGVKNAGPACTLLKQEALQAVIQEELIREYAGAHHITVAQADINREWSSIIMQKFGGSKPALTAWLRRLHETPQDLKDSVASDLLQQKVTYAVTGSVPSVVPGIRLAVIEAQLAALPFVKSHLQLHEDFLGLAKALKYVKSSNCQALKCGELGWVPLALIPANRKKLLTAPTGSVVGPFMGQQVFEMYYVQKRVQSLVLTSQQQYQIRLTKFAAWLAAQQGHAKVTRYVAV